MKTEIKTFCNGYAEALAPFAKTLNQALDEMPDGAGDSTLNEWRLRLREVAHRTDGLLDKLEQQQAYLLIFGPLKSGKSTLMNAVSGAYVSEVSSLPAYPALVYVKHGEKRRFRGTRYSGEAVDFEDHEAMSKAMSGGHAELANKILEAEKAGESFDPHRHYPEAIRRLDVETPAPALVDSGSALVDTPGLYTRMRFGYDVMTRDFRDTASCAIFVVKSDNLFFEKVFEEFNDLLGHFSRIFLVVNIDGSKRDLSPNGSLEPSLESREPSAIIEAFQSLAMSAPLRQAYDEGRLNVYPIDLLSAASRQLSRQAESGGAEALDAESKEDEEERQDGFSTFLGDLTSYLNSSDYFREFMGDSVRVGESLASEVKAVVETEAALKLNADADGWSRRLNDTKERRHALKVLDTIDWKSAFARAAEEKDRALEEQSEKDHSALGQHLSDALDRWLDSDDTLRGLRDDYLNPLIGPAWGFGYRYGRRPLYRKGAGGPEESGIEPRRNRGGIAWRHGRGRGSCFAPFGAQAGRHSAKAVLFGLGVVSQGTSRPGTLFRERWHRIRFFREEASPDFRQGFAEASRHGYGLS